MKFSFLKRFFDFCDKKLLHDLEVMFAITALIGFLLHVLFITLAKFDIIENTILAESGYITTLATPFTIILIYEIYLLAFSFTRSLINFLLLQFQVISLIFIRDLFKIFAEVEALSNGALGSITTDIIIDLLLGGILFLVVRILLFLVESGMLAVPQDSEKTKNFKRIISVLLLVGVTVALVDYLGSYSPDEFAEYISTGLSLLPFFEVVFTLMILADVIIFILALIDTDNYFLVFRNAVYLISIILIRLSLSADHPFDAYFVLIGVVSGVVVTIVEMKFKEWDDKYKLKQTEKFLGC